MYDIYFLLCRAALYPCRECGTHFSDLLKEYPIKKFSRQELSGYVCFLHNLINEKLSKPRFDCEKVSEYWGGDCGCKNH